jgi:AraC-like DNA-binding protein
MSLPEVRPRALPPTLLPASAPLRAAAPLAAQKLSARPKAPDRKAATAPAPAGKPALLSDPGAGFRIVPLPRLSQGGRWRTEAMRSYSAPVLLWFTRGQGRITVAGSTRGFTAHNAVFLPPGTMHGFEMSGQVFGHAVFFPRDSALHLPDRAHHLRFRDAVEQNELSQMIEHLQREIDRDLPGSERALTLHAGLLAVWLDRQIAALDAADTPENAARRLAAAFTALVERDFRLGRSIAAYAQDLGVTPTHLTRSCNSACGRPAHDILADRVFFEARSLLRDTATPVKTIAESLGFTSAAYFTRAFQKATGETPTGFRRKG